MSRTETAAEFTDDAFLGGRLQLLQPMHGFRAGLDAVMLAAAIPAEAGGRVLEAGLGNGAASLCLLARVGDAHVTGIEINEETAALARENAQRNGFAARLDVIAGDVEAGGQSWDERLPTNGFDHVFANPPYHLAHATRAPADLSKARAHQRDEESLDRWVRFLVGHARAGGSISLILPAAALNDALQQLERRTGGIVIFPLYPRDGEPAHRIILQGRKGSRAPLRLLQGLVLHQDGHAFTPQAEAILRHGAGLRL